MYMDIITFIKTLKNAGRDEFSPMLYARVAGMSVDEAFNKLMIYTNKNDDLEILFYLKCPYCHELSLTPNEMLDEVKCVHCDDVFEISEDIVIPKFRVTK